MNLSDNPESLDVEKYAKEMSGQSAETIRSMISALSATLETKRKTEIRGLYNEMTERAQKLGLENLNAFLVEAENLGLIKPTGAVRKPVAIRYRDPDQFENTWTGRGKKPKWLQAHLNNGRKLEEFLLPPSVDEEKPAKEAAE